MPPVDDIDWAFIYYAVVIIVGTALVNAITSLVRWTKVQISKRQRRWVSFVYTNYAGESAVRHVRPIRLYYGSTSYHPEEQWLLEAFDLDRGARRTFAVVDVSYWKPNT